MLLWTFSICHYTNKLRFKISIGQRFLKIHLEEQVWYTMTQYFVLDVGVVRVPERLLTSLKEELDQMLTMNITEPSRSDWCSPVVLVPMKDGSLRFCVEFHYLSYF